MKTKLISSITAIHLLWTAVSAAPTLSQPEVKVGRTTFSFTQPWRVEQFGPASGPRKIGGYIWYPARPSHNSQVSPFIVEPQASQLAIAASIPLELLQALPARSYFNAPIATSNRPYPILLMSHGDTGSPLESTSTAEALVEAGYVVVGINMTYNATAGFVEDELVIGDPDASVQAVQPLIDENSTFQDRLTNWDKVTYLNGYFARDISATIDELVRVNRRPGPFRGKLDLSRIGAFGHSFGGSQSYRALINDSRIDAAVNVDGTILDNAYKRGTRKPFMTFLSYRPNQSQVNEIRALLAQLGYTEAQINWIIEHSSTDNIAFQKSRRSIQVSIPRAGHNNFTDRGLWQEFGVPSEALSTELSPTWILNVYQTYLKAFFDQNVRGRNQPILHRSSGNNDIQVSWSCP